MVSIVLCDYVARKMGKDGEEHSTFLSSEAHDFSCM
ncbi:hypothetical protein BACCAP_01874 [Pseudoflavonifractor capillosus ATCC 29799]|uniref:Uncharacterized protein n=1 Tax=Pseudoflavonifractor capillosus ATCC 29799 TaxID=411467 RepID=A6NUJ2_9FIRM|nr:hypothetical protein BACCAP_01874 [Pseudoflavonifractor capillosus ATCC 29799]